MGLANFSTLRKKAGCTAVKRVGGVDTKKYIYRDDGDGSGHFRLRQRRMAGIFFRERERHLAGISGKEAPTNPSASHNNHDGTY